MVSSPNSLVLRCAADGFRMGSKYISKWQRSWGKMGDKPWKFLRVLGSPQLKHVLFWDRPTSLAIQDGMASCKEIGFWEDVFESDRELQTLLQHNTIFYQFWWDSCVQLYLTIKLVISSHFFSCRYAIKYNAPQKKNIGHGFGGLYLLI